MDRIISFVVENWQPIAITAGVVILLIGHSELKFRKRYGKKSYKARNG